jgi:prepilin-type N-terminal cleavage/methylation domain-containing protein
MGFTLVELLVVIAIIGILASLLFPVFSQAKEAAKTIKCLSNTRQIATATLLYSFDNDDFAPLAGYMEEYDANGGRFGWPHADRGEASSLSFATFDYYEDYDLFVCPTVQSRPSSYLFACAHGFVLEGLMSQDEADKRSLDGVFLGLVQMPDAKPLVLCSSPTAHALTAYSVWSAPPYPNGKQIAAYVDGHAEIVMTITWNNYLDLMFPPYAPLQGD